MKKISIHIERYFWLFLTTGIVTAFLFPAGKEESHLLIKPMLMVLMFAVFLKADLSEILSQIRNVRRMVFLVTMIMLVVPAVLFWVVLPFHRELAVAVLLLVSMPSAMAAPVITDLLGGNRDLSAGLSLLTSLAAPFTVPFLFWLLGGAVVEIDLMTMLLDILFFIFLPLALSQAMKFFFRETIEKKIYLVSSFNIFLLSIVVYFVISAHRQVILAQTWDELLLQVLYVYILFIALYGIGYLLGGSKNRHERIATASGTSFMNNGMAIVLASVYFSPYVLTLAVLSELPWNTLPGFFRRIGRLSIWTGSLQWAFRPVKVKRYLRGKIGIVLFLALTMVGGYSGKRHRVNLNASAKIMMEIDDTQRKK